MAVLRFIGVDHIVLKGISTVMPGFLGHDEQIRLGIGAIFNVFPKQLVFSQRSDFVLDDFFYITSGFCTSDRSISVIRCR